jgi:RNA polymerase sigma-70 factor (ECF subfamily)
LSRKAEYDHPRTERSDEELVAGIRHSDEGAFTVLYERYHQRVYNFVFLRLRNHADTEEAVQEAFTAVFRSIGNFGSRSSVLSWIYGIAKNTVNHHIRRAVAQEQRVERAKPELILNQRRSESGTPEDDLTLRRCAESVRNELDGLSSWQSEIFLLRHLENLPIAEISTRTSRSQDAVRSSLCRVKHRIVTAIEKGQDSSTERSQV